MAERPTGGVTPFLTIRDSRAREALDFYASAFAAETVEENVADDGKRLMQASFKVNGAWLMLSDEFPEYMGGPTKPAAGVMLHLTVDDADAWFDRAVAAGATVRMPVADMFWGDRYGQVDDPFGHSWSIGAPLK